MPAGRGTAIAAISSIPVGAGTGVGTAITTTTNGITTATTIGTAIGTATVTATGTRARPTRRATGTSTRRRRVPRVGTPSRPLAHSPHARCARGGVSDV